MKRLCKFQGKRIWLVWIISIYLAKLLIQTLSKQWLLETQSTMTPLTTSQLPCSYYLSYLVTLCAFIQPNKTISKLWKLVEIESKINSKIWQLFLLTTEWGNLELKRFLTCLTRNLSDLIENRDRYKKLEEIFLKMLQLFRTIYLGWPKATFAVTCPEFFFKIFRSVSETIKTFHNSTF